MAGKNRHRFRTERSAMWNCFKVTPSSTRSSWYCFDINASCSFPYPADLNLMLQEYTARFTVIRSKLLSFSVIIVQNLCYLFALDDQRLSN